MLIGFDLMVGPLQVEWAVCDNLKLKMSVFYLF